ncbi:type I 3-dehydroquinate dehydratase [Oceanobacillus sp. CAU 1775]
MGQHLTMQRLKEGRGMPVICCPITGETEEEILEQCKIISESGAELAEWRVDFYEYALNIEDVLEKLAKVRLTLKDLPILFSFRTKIEGGAKEISASDYLKLNQAVIESGFIQLIDIELFREEKVVAELISIAKEKNVYTVVSNHDFEQTPSDEEMRTIIKKAIDIGADIPKLAVMPQSEEDVLRVMNVNLHFKKEYPNFPFIMIAMGKLGVLTRMSGELFGSVLTFAAAKDASAPGQFSVHQLKEILKILHGNK